MIKRALTVALIAASAFVAYIVAQVNFRAFKKGKRLTREPFIKKGTRRSTTRSATDPRRCTW